MALGAQSENQGGHPAAIVQSPAGQSLGGREDTDPALKYLEFGARSGTGVQALSTSPLLHAPHPSTFQSLPFFCMDWSALRVRRSSWTERCAACKLRASTTTCCPCGSRGACECGGGGWGGTRVGLLGSQGQVPSLLLLPTSLPLPVPPARREGEVQAEEGGSSRTLLCPANPKCTSQPPSPASGP